MSTEDFLLKHNCAVGIGLSFLSAFIFAFTQFWWLALIAGISGGFICYKMYKGAIAGSIGVGSAWLLYMVIKLITDSSYTILDQAGGLLFGGSGFGWAMIIIVLLIAALLGSLGGYIGTGFRIILNPPSRRLVIKMNEMEKEKKITMKKKIK
jgi:hypothetical protein